MGRGRQKAKQRKVARNLKYFTPETDYKALERELKSSKVSDDEDEYEILDKWRDYLEGGKGAPSWMWPIIGMRGALGMRVDLHSGNVMKNPDNGDYIMTDPFSADGSYAGGYYTDL